MTRKIQTAFAILFAVFLLSGCKKKPEYPLCRNDSDCGEGEMCVDGRCMQCRISQDCPEGFECVDGVCKAPEESSGAAEEDTVAGASLTSSHEECSADNIYFAFDSYELIPAEIEKLKKAAHCLVMKGAGDVVIVGHCDPRGTEEYNMGLGLKRANAIKRFLVGYGIPKKEIEVYSKGEENATGYNEATWAKDRKGVFQ
jgi:peptidoglycan-associated lipoprotein